MCNLSETITSTHNRLSINDQSAGQELLHKANCLQLRRDGQTEKKSGILLKEHLMDIYINEHPAMKLVCIPEHLPELVMGRLLTEGIIRTTDDVKAIHICEYGTSARVFLNDAVRTCQSFDPVTPVSWKASWIFSLADRFAQGMPLHKETWCTHSCFLAMENRFLFQCEDIGRHNALDKVIGYALLHKIDLTRCIIYSSGRIPTDMVEKAIRAGIPILSSKASPTRDAVDLARQYHLILVCNARQDSMRLYTGQPPL